MQSPKRDQIGSTILSWWREQSEQAGSLSAARLLFIHLLTFARDSTLSRRRQRYGDMDYDWDNRVNTTTGTVGWRTRLLGLFHSPYQPTDPDLFREMLSKLPINFARYTFIDLGSGKGRTLMMASEFPFKKIIGVEILSDLHRAAVDNLQAYANDLQKCSAVETILGDATEFAFPADSLVLYLFNPLGESALAKVVNNLQRSLDADPRDVYILYHNPAAELVLARFEALQLIVRTPQYAIYAFTSTPASNQGSVCDRT